MKLKTLLFIATSALTCTMAKAGQQVARPKLVVGLVIDQMRWDYLYRYMPHYGEGGFKVCSTKAIAAKTHAYPMCRLSQP